MTRIMGIDPGHTGGIALIVDGHLQEVATLPQQTGGKTTSGRGLAEHIRAWNPDLIVIEAVHCNGQNGSKANWSLGHSMGTIEGVVEALRQPSVKMSPQEWKKLSGLIGKTKDDGRALAQALWPHHYQTFNTKAWGEGRADAALIARAYVMKMVREHHEEEATCQSTPSLPPTG